MSRELTTPVPRRLRNLATAAAVLVLAALLGFESCSDAHGDVTGLGNLMAAEARGLADVVAHVAADALAGGGTGEQLVHVVELLDTDPRVRYVAVTEDGRVLTATGAAAGSMAPPEATGHRTGVREFDTPDGTVLEITRPLPLSGGRTLAIRVGLDAEPLATARRDTVLRQRVHSGLVLASVVLIVALLLARQRQATLDREISRVSDRLARHEAEARRQDKLVAMGALAAGVAHQLRNPLNSIHMLAQVMAGDRDLPPQVAERARQIHRESARLDARISEFLEFARPRSPVIEDCDLGPLVMQVAELQSAARAASGVEVIGYAPHPLVVPTDRGFVREILENLMRNALEAGATRVLASLAAVRDRAEITVADDGPGVPAAERERIFDLYYTSRPDGTGLGLSLANQMAAALSGTLTLSDAEGLSGRGAMFVLQLPLRRSES
jgi:two-component system sensor histidine kinase HydH